MKEKTAIVYDWIDSAGGVERLLLVLDEMFPDADWYSSFVDYNKAEWAARLKIKTSWMQKLPIFLRNNRIFCTPLFPYAFESFNFSSYSRVISISSSFAKGIITRPTTEHVCYMLTPPRFLWSHKSQYLHGGVVGSVFHLFASRMRRWDAIVSKRPDKIIAISKTVSERVGKTYHLQSSVIYPPFDLKYWGEIKQSIKNENKLVKHMTLPSEYYLIVSRLEKYKKVDLAIEALTGSNIKLVIAGTGRYEQKLKNISSKNVIYLGRVSDADLGILYSNAKALIMPQEEDFGYTAVEAIFFGCPVIAYSRGGAAETIEHEITGVLFKDQSVMSLKSALDKYHTISYNIQNTTKIEGEKKVEKYSKSKFIQTFLSHLR